MDGLPVEGLPEDEGHTFARTQISQPIPREDPFNRDDKIITRRRNALEEISGLALQF
jgi:hypothetical protein